MQTHGSAKGIVVFSIPNLFGRLHEFIAEVSNRRKQKRSWKPKTKQKNETNKWSRQ